MDKTYSDLMDIVNRIKKIDEKSGKAIPNRMPKKPVEEEIEEDFDELETIVDEKPKTKEKPSLFAESSALNKFMTTSKSKKEPVKEKETPKKSPKTTKTAKSTAKSTPKATPKKPKTETAEKKVEAPKPKSSITDLKAKLGNIKKKEVVKKTESEIPKLDMTNPKNQELYNVLHSTLFAGGTDISEYDDSVNNETTDMLSSLETKRKANEINQEITKEQQEYEKLFTGSFIGDIKEELNSSKQMENQSEDEAYRNALRAMQENSENIPENNESEENLESDGNDIGANVTTQEDITHENVSETDDTNNETVSDNYTFENVTTDYKGDRFTRDIEELKARNSEMDAKIAEYYKRKQEALDKYNASINSDEIAPETEPSENEEMSRQQAYEDIFSGSMMSREELLNEMSPVEEEKAEETYPETATETELPNEEIVDSVAQNRTENENVENTEEEEKTGDSEFMSLYKTLNDETFDETFTHADSETTDSMIRDMSEYKSNQIIDEVMGIENEEPEETRKFPMSSEYSNYIYGGSVSSNITSTDTQAISNEDSNEQTEENIESEDIEESDQDELVGQFDEKTKNGTFKETYTEDDIVESVADQFEEEQKIDDNVYDLSASDSEIDDYILSSNMPVDEELEQKPIEQTYATVVDDEIGDNQVVMEMHELPESRIDVLGQKIDRVESDEIDSQDEQEKAKQESFDEMARLQENLVSQLNGNDNENNTIQNNTADILNNDDFVKENSFENEAIDLAEEKETEDEKAIRVTDELIVELEKDMAIGNIVGDSTSDDDTPVIEDNYDSIEVVAEEKETEENIENSEEVNLQDITESIENMNLLDKDVALNEADLEYIVNSEKPREVKDDYFYLSAEDKEKQDEYLTVYDENSSKNEKEVGDINLNKNIGNAVPYSKESIYSNKKVDDMETIYTLFGAQRKKMEKKNNEEIKVLYVASECQPFIASGGLADVAGSLPKAVAKEGGVDIRVMLPLYGNIKQEYRDKFEYLGNFTVHLSWRQEYCGIFKYVDEGVTYYFVDNERYFKRDKIYGYYDDGERFAYFCKAVVESLPLINFFPEIIHCNDWQSALVSTYIKTGNWSDFRYYKIKNIYTIHNVEYQGVYGMENLKDLFGIDSKFTRDMEYNGDINLTKAAIQFSDKFTTVSDSYCDNLKQPYCSRGLHHIIIRNEYKLSGIINGVDYDFYNPMTDRQLYKNYNVDTLQDKVMNKKLWQDELGLPVDGRTPMLAIVSRLVSHKGLDLVSKVMETVLQKDIQLVVVGTGDQRFIDYFKYLENKYPTKVRAMVDKFSNELARKAYGASDIFLMPSKIEPCGISQMIASIYGSVPIVREVGGLRDTIKDFGCAEGGNGYTFASYNPNDLLDRINKAVSDYENQDDWEKKMRICMTQDFTWSKSARKYIDLYKSLID